MMAAFDDDVSYEAQRARLIASSAEYRAQRDRARKPNGAATKRDVLDELDNGPLPLFPPLQPAEPFPVDALGPVLAPAAAAIARKVQAPAAIAGQSVLAAAALAAQAHADVRMPYGQSRPLSLFFVTVAGSGDRKSSSDNEALWPIHKRERTLKEEHDLAFEAWRIAHTAWTAEERKISRNSNLDFEGRKSELAALGPEPQRPLLPMLTCPDPTIEGLHKAMVAAPASLGVFATEGGQFTNGHGMSQDNRLRTASGWSGIWDSITIKRVRALDGVSMLDGRRVTMHLMIQPAAAVPFLADPTLRDQGLLSRMLVAAPDSLAGTRFYREPDPADEAAIRAYGARILSILEAPWPLAEGRANELVPRALPLNGEVEAAWCAFHDHVEAQSGPEQELAQIGNFAAKVAEHAARIAGVLTIVGDMNAHEIGLNAMTNAIVLGDWYLAEVLRLQQGARTDQKLLRAQSLLDWARAHGPEVRFNDALKFGPAALRTKERLDEAVKVLVEHGWFTGICDRPRTYRVEVES